MDIGTNELTRPFRIPRRKAEEDRAPDGSSEKAKRRRLGGESDLRSPLVSTSSVRRNDSAFSSRIVPPTKKKPAQQDHQQAAVHSKKPKPGELFDRILDSMVNPPKERRKDTSQDEVDEAGPSGLTANSNTNISKSRPFVLTREELERRQDDNSACYSFMQREGLMERLLGHKMLTGRVDSHVVLGFLPLDPKDNSPSKNHNNASSTKIDDFPSVCEPPAVAFAVEERRGPKTPPGSPEHDANSSMLSSRGVGSASPSSPPPPPPVEETNTHSAEDKVKADETPDLIAEMAELTKLPHNQLAECLGEELQKAMKQVDHKVLLETLKDALLKVGRKNDAAHESQQEAYSSNVKEDMRTYPIEMDLESNRSANTNDALLPPPPPAPRTPPTTNLMTALPVGLSAAVAPSASILPTPPPPPPLVMLHPAAAPQVLVDRSTTGSACASAVFPYFPPPPPQLAVGQGAKTMVTPQTAATPIMFTGVPYTTNLGATPSLAVPAVNLTSQAASAVPRAPGMVNASPSIPATPYVSANPTVPYAAANASQTATFSMQPGSSQCLPKSAPIVPCNQYTPATLSSNNSHNPADSIAGGSAGLNDANNLQHPVVLHPYANATNYNIFGTSAPYSVPTTSSTISAADNSLTTVTNSPVHHRQQQLQQQQQQQQHGTVTNFSYSNRSQQQDAGFYSAACDGYFPVHASFSESMASQKSVEFSHQLQYQASDYSHHQGQQSHRDLVNPLGTPVGPNVAGAYATPQQPDESRYQSDFSRPPPNCMQNSQESNFLPVKECLLAPSSTNFNGEASSRNFLSPPALKKEALSSNVVTAPPYNADQPSMIVSSPSANDFEPTLTNFNKLKTSEEPISVPSSQNVIKTLLSALSIPQSSSAGAPNNSSLAPEVNDSDQEVDFCWPPSNLDEKWGQEAVSSLSDQSVKVPSKSLSGGNAPRMMFFDQPVPMNAPPPPSVGGTLMLRPRPPVNFSNRMSVNRLSGGPVGPPPPPGMLRAGPPFRPSGPPLRPPFPPNMSMPMRSRFPPPFLPKRLPFPFRPPPPGVRMSRPPFPR